MSTTRIEYGLNPDGTPGRTWPFEQGCGGGGSAGCVHCFARDQARRYGRSFAPRFCPEHLDDPLRARDTKPLTFLGAFGGDWLDPAITDEQLLQVADVLRRNECRDHPHTIILLTKQAERLNRFWRRLRWWGGEGAKLFLTPEPDDRPSAPVPEPDAAALLAQYGQLRIPQNPYAGHLGPLLHHFWAGVSVCTVAEEYKAGLLLAAPLGRRFLSLEPLLERVRPILKLVRTTLDTYPAGKCTALDLVIAGGESGPGARPCALEWLTDAGRACREAGVPFWLKQLGSFIVSEARAWTEEEAREQGLPYRWAWRAGLEDRKGADPAEWTAELLELRGRLPWVEVSR